MQLHRAVLDKALIDWFDTDNKKLSNDTDEWLRLDNEDFIECCERAFLEPTKVYRLFYEVRNILEENRGACPGEEIR